MPVDLALIGVAVALLAPVYTLLWTIQRKLGCIEATIDGHERRLTEVET